MPPVRKLAPRHRLLPWLRRINEARRQLRDQEAMLVILSTGLGAVVGLAVSGLHMLLLAAQGLLFRLPSGGALSGLDAIPSWPYLLVPAVGGLVLGVWALLAQRIRPAEIVDPIEANALYGGKMSLWDSLRLAWLTLLSNLSGASVGMEAGYSQLGASLFSAVAQPFRLRREDKRCLTSAGAAAAIAAAFNAPLAGAFYGFELVHGSYAPRNIAIIGAAVISGTLARRAVEPHGSLFELPQVAVLPDYLLPLFIVIGLLAALTGTATMRLVSVFERMFQKTRLPVWARPAAGGLILGGMALTSPQILGSGHDAIQGHISQSWGLSAVALLLAGKLLASALSLGAGFRGGLFSSSLFLGCLLGALIVQLLTPLLPGMAEVRIPAMLAGMAAVGAAITGAPLTMVFLVLEITGNFAFTLGVLTSAFIAATVVRLTFGYSFSTWRFHLRGIPLLGAHDVGWVRELTAGRMMRGDIRRVPLHQTIAHLRQEIPLGSRKYAFAVDDTGRYAGIIDMATVHDPEISDLADVLVAADCVIGPEARVFRQDNIQAVLDQFSRTQLEILPVLDGPGTMRVIGSLTEAYCLKRYAQELDSRRSDEIGAP
ncbi:chloride channel protein [Paracoccus limosus]|uniref:Chloride channel protein n=1 Tax=Paracoccus limosus TaxID=913252 RepID=A0A844H9Z1_9RHOB|nr:chloride channel protein [Paracoccus limosus]MTH36291.1 chloride channel protein [Paracoccus limosus]